MGETQDRLTDRPTTELLSFQDGILVHVIITLVTVYTTCVRHNYDKKAAPTNGSPHSTPTPLNTLTSQDYHSARRQSC